MVRCIELIFEFRFVNVNLVAHRSWFIYSDSDVEVEVMPKRFVFAFLAFVGLIVPGAFTLAQLAAPSARPAATQLPGCDRSLADTANSVAAMQERVKSLGATDGPEACHATQRYFLEVLKARAVTALCNIGADSGISLVSRGG